MYTRCPMLGAPADIDPGAAFLSAAQSPRAPGSVSITRTATGNVLSLHGEIDAATVAEFQRRADEHRTASAVPDVHVIDFTEATFVNSMAISLIVRLTASSRLAGRRPVMRGWSRQVRQVFDMVGLSEMFEW